MDLVSKLNAQRQFFDSGATKEYAFRLAQVKKLKAAVEAAEEAIYEALYTDLKKSPEECWITENGFFLSELSNAIGKLSRWMKPERVRTNLANLPSKSLIVPEPLGVVLIISPWNYPFQLLFTPLIGAMAAGNCVVLKSSEFAPATSAVMKRLIEENFDPAYILFTEGDGATVVPHMMNNFVFDHVFYTGSTAVGKIIYQAAANNLVPVTLELGGKSPCVVEADADIKVAAKRIAFPKFSNAGQMCVAPDYVLVHASQKDALVAALKQSIEQFFKGDAAASYDYGRIINQKQFDRLITYFNDGKVLYGGRSDRDKLYIEPTLMDAIDLSGAIMHDEIFGPILPIIAFNSREEALAIINRNKNPLAFYLFTSGSQNEQWWLQSVAFGGGCVNNASVHLVNHRLPFGGRGASGMGKYHGRFSFDTFSHQKSVLKTPTWIDPAIKYPPYEGRLGLLKRLIG
ncbi:aldehyde dehydrogenase [Ferruginibacter sp. HRS2-29]|uniref:aldehyde dehydrogenase n=1 Tax=Ferruginibacter sp. HRS2-29 TaxID=2487334 RepID=UPI0020CC50E0|nr:aldehyde dehydrogenase [Ferruginibacter sp. HRS2-29]MCP9750456.1 aldehyde dehydrogenase [Ferruginibacter sp. HRS2-29]